MGAEVGGQQLVGRLRGELRVDVGAQDGRPVAREALGDRPSNAASGARNDGNLVVQR